MTKSHQEMIDEWERNNDSFQYEPPDAPPDAWASEDYTKLYDRVISRRVTWVCQKCSQPHGSIEKARRHVQNRHSESLIESVASRKGSDD